MVLHLWFVAKAIMSVTHCITVFHHIHMIKSTQTSQTPTLPL